MTSDKLSLIFLMLPVVAAGCIHTTGTGPEIISSELHAGTINEITGNTNLDVTVENRGEAGAVNIIATIFDSQGNSIQQFNRTLQMEEGERRSVTLQIDVPENAADYSVRAVSAGNNR